MSSNFVDFKVVKAVVGMQMVLDRYAVNGLAKKGDELRGRCPIHKGEGTDTFHVNVTKNAFQCFSCKARGNVLDFVAAMEKSSVRDAALKLAQWFSIPENGSERSSTPAKDPAPPKSGGEDRVGTIAGSEAPTENKPLTFQLKGVDPDHEYLKSRGVARKTAELFGVGFFPGKGSMSGRVVIPIHNERGELVAYAGRSIDGMEPRYKLPAGFHKSLELYNVHRAVMDNDPRLVVVVEGFFDCMHVYQAGFPCVALMGCSMSEEQERMLASHFRAIWLLLDGDEAGRTAAVEIAGRLVRRLFVKVVGVGDDLQPDQLQADGIRELLLGASSVGK